MTTAGSRQLIALDVDGTVLLEDETLAPGAFDAVQAVVAAGHEVTLSTGRSWVSTEPVLRALGLRPDFVVCANGAIIFRLVDGEYERWHTETFDPTAALELLREHLPDAHYMVELGDGSRLFTEEIGYWDLSHGEKVTFEQLAAQPVTRVVVISPEHTEADFVELIERIGLNQVSYAIGWTAWLDIAPQGVDKGSALKLVTAFTGHDPAETVVIGDGRNDLGMFAWAREHGGTAVAMGQAADEVRAAATFVTGSVDEGGVAEALARLSVRA